MKLLKNHKEFFLLCISSIVLQIVYYNITHLLLKEIIFFFISCITGALVGYIVGYSAAHLFFWLKNKRDKFEEEQ